MILVVIDLALAGLCTDSSAVLEPSTLLTCSKMAYASLATSISSYHDLAHLAFSFLSLFKHCKLGYGTRLLSSRGSA